MSARLRAIAQQTVQIMESGRYTASNGRAVDISEPIESAVRRTRVFGPEPVVPIDAFTPTRTSFEVTGEGSLAAARRMVAASPEPVAVLNFASARRPGGGFLTGAQAQEEYLCRLSALHRCLLGVPQFYESHRANRSTFYSDRVILAPDVPVFRNEDKTLMAKPFSVGFLTCAAPNASVIIRTEPREAERIPGALSQRAARVLEVAAVGGYPRLVLGAWGCGVFRNSPDQVAKAFHDHLGPGGAAEGRFSQVVFAVLNRRAGSGTITAFSRVFGDG